MSRPNELRLTTTRFYLLLSLFAALAAPSSCGGDEPQGTGGMGGAGGAGGGGFFCFPGDTEPCYTGPVASKNVGACREGERTCVADGSMFGVCVGEVKPVPDDCATPADEDCDGVPGPPCPGTGLFGLRFGGIGEDEGRAVAFDAAGNLYATGSFEGSIDFGGGELKSAGGKDVFVARLSEGGDALWAKAFSGVGALQEGLAAAVDSSGNALVAGSFEGTLDVDGTPHVSLGGQDAFAAKLDAATGARVWSAAFGGLGKQVARAIAVEGADSALVGGGFDGSIDFGTGPLLSAGGEDGFLVKVAAADGSVTVGSQLGDAMNQAITGVAAQSGGGYVIAGRFEGSIAFGAESLQSAGAEDIFVASYSAPGELVFSKAFGDKGSQIPEAVAVDAAGGIVIAGRFNGSLDLGHKPPLPGTDAYDIFIGKLDATGAYVYGYAYGGTFDQVALGVAVDSMGNAAVTGSYFGSLKLGADPMPSAGQRDVFMTKLAP